MTARTGREQNGFTTKEFVEHFIDHHFELSSTDVIDISKYSLMMQSYMRKVCISRGFIEKEPNVWQKQN